MPAPLPALLAIPIQSITMPTSPRQPVLAGRWPAARTASHFSKRGAMLGLEFWFRFRQPIYSDETITLEWLVVAVNQNRRLNGEIIDLRGRIRKQNGETAVGAKGRVLVTAKL
jgi:3-hydroxybutyryl-CoA dehydratase